MLLVLLHIIEFDQLLLSHQHPIPGQATQHQSPTADAPQLKPCKAT
jgi:hypothetical protein